MSRSSRTVLILVILLLAVLLALGNMLSHALVVQELTGTTPPAEPGLLRNAIQSVAALLAKGSWFVWFFAGAPLVVGAILSVFVLLIGRGTAHAAPQRRTATAADPEVDGALRLLALLQQEGRLVDFLEEDIEPYADAQVGAAVRAIHAGCRSALHQRMRIERIYAQDDGTPVEVEAGFDASEVRLTGNVHGSPPFHGVLQHGGWRVADVALPKSGGVDAAVLAPAEVEVS
jgi:hypothetical protein